MKRKVKFKPEMIDNPPPKMGFPAADSIPRMPTSPIGSNIDELDEHLKKYVQILLDNGADDARIISAREIPQDPRVLLKCHSPRCPFYGVSGSCPPHFSTTFQQAKENLSAYNWAIAFRLDIPDEVIASLTGPGCTEVFATKEGFHQYGSLLRYLWRMGDAAESAAYYDGHYFAINCHFGPCLIGCCEEFGQCQEIKTGKCRFPLRAKPSIEQSFSPDLMKLATRLGWKNHMWGYCAYPQDFPDDYTPFAIGLVLIE
jgi:predicted metal-binding protein